MRYLLALATVLIAIWLWSVPAHGQPPEEPVKDSTHQLFFDNHIKLLMIKDYINSPLADDSIHEEGVMTKFPLTYKTLHRKENLANHDHFDWVWDDHYVTLYCEGERCFLRFQVKVYQEFVSPDSRGFVVWTIVDLDMDGEFNSARRDHELVMQNKVMMMPEFPEGYINTGWYKPSKEKAQARFEHEINYWVSLIPEVII
jgi:hypothetical protein